MILKTMRKATSILTVLAVIASLFVFNLIPGYATPAVDDGNLITDGSFENRSDGAITLDQNSDRMVIWNGTGTIVTDKVSDGSKALKVTPDGSEKELCFVYFVSLEQGKTYTFSMDVCAPETYLKLRPKDADAEQDMNCTTSCVGTTGFRRMTFEYTAKADYSNARVKFSAGAATTDKVAYIDNVVVKEKVLKRSIGGVMLQKETSEGVFERVPLSDMSAGKRQFKVTDITNPTAEAFNLGVILARYDSKGACADVQMTTVPVAADGKNLTASVQLTVPDGVTDGSLKSFLWDLDTLRPFEKPVKILVIGNSITQHDPAVGKGWLGYWGMAATTPEKDYVHQLLTKAEAANDNTQMKWVNISEFEKFFYNWNDTTQNPFNVSRYQEYVDFDADIVICTIGANINNSANEGDSGFESGQTFTAAHYQAIISHFNPDGDAEVIVGLTALLKDEIKTTINAAATEKSWPVVDMTNLSDDKYKAKANEQELKTAFGVDTIDSGVLDHPGNEGMKAMADALWTELENAMNKLKI